jgi:hypothetical protein
LPVVIAIIAVLMAVLMSPLRLARDHAPAITSADNLRLLMRFRHLYNDDYGAKIVDGHVGGSQWGRFRRAPSDSTPSSQFAAVHVTTLTT